MTALEQTASPDSPISLRDGLGILLRHKATIVQTFVAVFAVGAAITFLSSPIYRSGARILVESNMGAVPEASLNLPLSDVFLPLGATERSIATQMEILQSDRVVSDAYKRAVLRPGSVRLKANQVESTDVIALTVESNRPADAERMAQALPEAFRSYVVHSHNASITNALAFVQNRYQTENDKLVHATLALQRFRQSKHISNLEKEREERIGQTVTNEKDVSNAEAILMGRQAQLSHWLALRKTLPATIVTPVTTTNNLQITQIKDQIAMLNNQRASLLVVYKPTHVKVQEVDAQIQDLQAQLKRTPATVTTMTRSPNPSIVACESKIAEARGAVASAAAELARMRVGAAKAVADLSYYDSLETAHSQLQREVDRHSATVALLAKTLEDLNLRAKASHDPVMTISPSEAASLVAPKKAQNLIFSALVGLLLAFCAGLLQERLDDRIHTPLDSRLHLNAPALGHIPLLEPQEARGLQGSRKSHVLMESYRVLRSNVQFSCVDAPVHSLLVTSSASGEGKSFTACNLATVTALNGHRVLLVDADLRRPTLHEKFGLRQQPGLTNVLLGQLSLDQALQETHVPGLHVLTSGVLPPNPAELLNSRAMRDLHAALRERADIVIYDSPPALAVTDAQVLATDVDGVLFVVGLGEARKSSLRHVQEFFELARVRVLGVVFNKTRTSGKAGYGYYGGYFGAYRTEPLITPLETSPLAVEFEALTQANGHKKLVKDYASEQNSISSEDA